MNTRQRGSRNQRRTHQREELRALFLKGDRFFGRDSHVSIVPEYLGISHGISFTVPEPRVLWYAILMHVLSLDNSGNPFCSLMVQHQQNLKGQSMHALDIEIESAHFSLYTQSNLSSPSSPYHFTADRCSGRSLTVHLLSFALARSSGWRYQNSTFPHLASCATARSWASKAGNDVSSARTRATTNDRVDVRASIVQETKCTASGETQIAN